MTLSTPLSHMDNTTAENITNTAAQRAVEGFEQACDDVAAAMAKRQPLPVHHRDFLGGKWAEYEAANEVKS